MKTLDTLFKQNGFTLKQRVRDGNFAIYERVKGEIPAHFEVVRIKRHNGYTISGNSFPPAEYYPSASQWGTDGFTLHDFDSAMEKLASLKDGFALEDAK